MKKILTLITVICVLAVSLTCFALYAVADDGIEYKGTVAGANTCISAYSSAEDDEGRISAAKSLSEYLRNNPIDPDSNGYDAFASSLDAVLVDASKIYLATFSTELKVYECKEIIGWVESFIGHCVDAQAQAGYAELAADLAAKKKACDDKYEAARKALVEATPLGEQENGVMYAMNNFDNHGSSFAMANAETSGIAYSVRTHGDNNYFGVDSKGYKQSKFTYASLTGASNYDRFVLEFDISFFTETLYLQLNTTEDGYTTNARVGAYFVEFTNNAIKSSGHKLIETDKSLDMPTPVVPTKWTHVTVIYDDVEYILKLYIDNEYVGSYFAKSTEPFNLTHFRLALTPNNTKVGFAIDNVVMYEGTGPREIGIFDGMNAEEKFIYLSKYLTDAENETHVQSRVWAYAKATEQISAYWDAEKETYIGAAANNAELQAAVDAYVALDKAALNQQSMDFNSREFIAKVDRLKVLGRSFAELQAIGKSLEVIDEFLTLKGGSVNVDFEGYADALAYYTQAKNYYASDIVSYEFVTIMSGFVIVGSYENKLAVYNKAKAYLEENGIVSTDSIDTSIGEEKLNEAIETYNNAFELLKDLLRKENSERVIAYMTYAYDYQDMAAWEENFVKLSYMVTRTRSILSSVDNYNPDIEGMEQAIEWYNLINPYFYHALQKEHVEYLDSLHARYKTTDSYIEKLTVCGMVEEYISENDIDYTNVDIDRLITEHRLFKSELESLKQNYENELESNAILFVDVIKKLIVANSYAEIKALVAEAELYYYSMYTGTKEAKIAVAYFEAAREELAVIHAKNDEFAAVVQILSEAQSYETKYKLLVDGYSYLPYIVTDIDGMKNVFATYATIYNEYVSLTQPANEELAETVACTAALRFNCETQRIVAMLLEIYR